MIIVAAVLGLSVKGLNFGIEFIGGAQYTVTMPQGEVTQDNADKLRDAVADTGIPAAQQVIVTTAGKSSILVQTEPLTPVESTRISSDDPGHRRGDQGRRSPATRSGRAGARRSPNGR